jgi:hypothetical protein
MNIDGFWYFLVGILAICFTGAAICATVSYPGRRRLVYKILGIEGVKEGYVVDETETQVKIRDSKPSEYQEKCNWCDSSKRRPIYTQTWHEKSKIEVIRGWR